MKQSEQLYIPVEVVRFILDHRRRRLAAEADPRTIQKFLGHSSLEMTDRYMSKLRIDKDESWRKVADLIGLDSEY